MWKVWEFTAYVVSLAQHTSETQVCSDANVLMQEAACYNEVHMWQVWEVAAQLTGLALSILLLNAIDATGDPTNAVWAWVGLQCVHVGLRYKSLSVIQLPTLNQKRSCALVNAFVRGQKLPGRVWGFLGSGIVLMLNQKQLLRSCPCTCAQPEKLSWAVGLHWLQMPSALS